MQNEPAALTPLTSDDRYQAVALPHNRGFRIKPEASCRLGPDSENCVSGTVFNRQLRGLRRGSCASRRRSTGVSSLRAGPRRGQATSRERIASAGSRRMAWLGPWTYA
jgi:hypothetical protein